MNVFNKFHFEMNIDKENYVCNEILSKNKYKNGFGKKKNEKNVLKGSNFGVI